MDIIHRTLVLLQAYMYTFCANQVLRDRPFTTHRQNITVTFVDEQFCGLFYQDFMSRDVLKKSAWENVIELK